MEKLLADFNWWEAGLCLAMLAFGWAGSWFIKRTLVGRLKAVAPDGEAALRLQILKSLVPLLRWGLLLAALAVALHLFVLPAAMERWLNTLLRAAATILGAAVAGGALAVAFDHWARFPAERSEARSRATVAPLLSRVCQVFLQIVAVLMILQDLGFNVAGLLTGLGIGGLAVALAAKETLANFFGSVALLLDRPFQVGDTVRYADVQGRVERIGLRSTRVRTDEGYLVSIPNQIVTGGAVANITARRSRRQDLQMGLFYNLTAAQVAQVLKIVRDSFAAHPQTEDVWVYWKDFGPAALNVQISHWTRTKSARESQAALEEINLRIKEQLEASGLGRVFQAAPA